MAQRPVLGRELDSATFRSFYYLKEELTRFCRENELPTTGGKPELTERIAYFLDTGDVLPPAPNRTKRSAVPSEPLCEDSVIEENFVCSEVHRAFFRQKLGSGFSFRVAFQKWLKSNAGKTYRDAIAAYRAIMAAQKPGKSEIDGQFEYNTYIRAFFAANHGKTLADAIRCWNYKKSLPGHNRYEAADLVALDDNC